MSFRAGRGLLAAAVGARIHVAGGNRCDPGGRIKEADLPQRSGVGARAVVRVEGVNTVVLRGDKYDIARSFARDLQA